MELIHLAIKKVYNSYYNSKFRILLGVDLNLQGLFKFVKSSGSKKYERLFLLSEKFIYKLESYSITSFQWAVAIEAIHTIKLHKTNKFLIKICVKSSVNKKVSNQLKRRV